MEQMRTTESCSAAMVAVKDALYVLGGKWKLPIIVSLQDGPRRFKEPAAPGRRYYSKGIE